MATHVERSIEVAVPVRTAYDQWTQFEEFPRFMGGVQEVRQVGDAMTHWVAEIGGVRREWDAAILEQVPDAKVAWAATSGATNAGAVFFQAVGDDRTQVRLTLDYEPEGFVERVADVLDIIDRQAVADLDRFKEFIEQRGSATGAWRGRVEDGDVAGGTSATGAATGAAASAAAVATDGPGELQGDVAAVGPTHSTLETEGHGGAVASRPGESVDTGGPTGWTDPDEVAESGSGGDPLFVDPTAAGARTGTVEDPAAVHPAREHDNTGADTGTGRGAAAAVAGDAVSGSTAGHEPGQAAHGTAGPTADAATSASGVSGFGTDTGLRSDDPSSGAFTGDPEPRADTIDRPAAQKDFANRDVVSDDAQRDFADRDITQEDVARKGVTTGMGGARGASHSAREGMEGDTGFQGETPPTPAEYRDTE